jgi:hypothetical protein
MDQEEMRWKLLKALCAAEMTREVYAIADPRCIEKEITAWLADRGMPSVADADANHWFFTDMTPSPTLFLRDYQLVEGVWRLHHHPVG